MEARLIQALEDIHHFGLEAIQRESQRDQGIVMWPDRSIVIRQRVVTSLSGGDGANPPTGKHPFAEQSFSGKRGPFCTRHLATQRVTSVCSPHPALLFIAIHS